MLRACSVPLCSHRRERQVIYLLFFFSIPDLLLYSPHTYSPWLYARPKFIPFAPWPYALLPPCSFPLFPLLPFSPWPLFFSFYGFVSFLLCWEVSWCSWLSHHFYVVRVPGSNPGGTIFMLLSGLLTTRPWPYLLFSLLSIGRFISSRIHPFPSEHGSKDA